MALAFLQLVRNHHDTGVGIAFEQISEQSPRGLTGRVSVHNVCGRAGKFEIAQVRRKHRIEKLQRDLKARIL